MMQRLTAWFPVLLLALGAAVTVWLDRQVQAPEYTRDAKARHDPDYEANNFSTMRTGPDGLPRYTLRASSMVHYPDDDTTDLVAPRIVSFGKGNTTVTATAKKANLSSNGEHVFLIDDVKLVRSASGTRGELTMQTSWLHIVPDDNIAKTDRPVRISDANILITSVGLEFNNETRILKLLSNVRGRYEKPAPGP